MRGLSRVGAVVVLMVVMLLLSACGSITEPVPTFDGGRFELVAVDGQSLPSADISSGSITLNQDGTYLEVCVTRGWTNPMNGSPMWSLINITGTWTYENGRVHLVPTPGDILIVSAWYKVSGDTLTREDAPMVYLRK